ncbi:hypothetical protein [Polynucleobacter sp.]|uniref:hypothetical protein n=1 Tax=Polynucleobacter sp. TaxID=2029855 RepID=UPI003F699782
MVNVQIKGEEIVLKHLKMLADSNKLFDEELRDVAINSQRELIKETIGQKNLRTGNTSRAWTSPFKAALLNYRVENDYKTRDGQYNVARLIDTGHKTILPKKAKMLFIPLTRKGQMKPMGAKTTGLKRGIDFILTKKVKALAGKKYLDRIRSEASIDLTKRLIAKIRGVFKS